MCCEELFTSWNLKINLQIQRHTMHRVRQPVTQHIYERERSPQWRNMVLAAVWYSLSQEWAWRRSFSHLSPPAGPLCLCTGRSESTRACLQAGRCWVLHIMDLSQGFSGYRGKKNQSGYKSQFYIAMLTPNCYLALLLDIFILLKWKNVVA